MVDALALGSVALVVLSTVLLVMLVVRRFAVARRERRDREAEERLRPFALALVEGEGAEPSALGERDSVGLPRSGEPGGPRRADHEGVRQPESPTPSPLILVVDDDADIRALVALRLERASYRVATAADGFQAFDRAVELRPDLIVLDVNMPGRDGFETSRLLREHPTTAHIPVVFLTARTQETDVVMGYEHGGDGYVRKPFEPGELVARVESLIGVGRMRELAAG